MSAILTALSNPLRSKDQGSAKEVQELTSQVKSLENTVKSLQTQVDAQAEVISQLLILLNQFLKEIVTQGNNYNSKVDDMLSSAKLFLSLEFQKLKDELLAQRESISSDIQELSLSMEFLSLIENDDKAKLKEELKANSVLLKEALDKALALSSQLPKEISTPSPPTPVSEAEVKRLIGESVSAYSKFLMNSLAPLKPVWNYLAETWPSQNKPRILEYMKQHLSQSSSQYGTSSPSHQKPQGGETEKTDETAKPHDTAKPDTAKPPSQPTKGILIGTPHSPPPKQIQPVHDPNDPKGKKIKISESTKIPHQKPGSEEQIKKDEELAKILMQSLSPDEVKELEKVKKSEEHDKMVKESRAMELRWLNVNPLTHFELMPRISFNLNNSDDIQLDLPISPNAPSYKAYPPRLNETYESDTYNHRLRIFYATFSQKSDPFSLSKIVAVKVNLRRNFEGIALHSYQVLRGSKKREDHFSEADFPRLNPYDLIVLQRYFMANLYQGDFMHNISHFLRCYMDEIARTDFDFGRILNRPTAKPDKSIPEALKAKKFKLWDVVFSPSWGIMTQEIHPNKEITKIFFRLFEKERYSSEWLSTLLPKFNSSHRGPKLHRTKITEVLYWWLQIRKELIREVRAIYPGLPIRKSIGFE